MDRAEVLNTARQADIEVAHMSNGKIRTDAEIREQWVICFATMIEALVKEKAAKVCEKIDLSKKFFSEPVALECAAAIRAIK